MAAVDTTAKSDSGGGFKAYERYVYGFLIAIVAVAMAISIFTMRGQLRTMETVINDTLRVRVQPHAAEQNKEISVVVFNEETLVQFPYRSPVDRAFLADLTNALAEAGAKGIIFDILFDQPTEPAKDQALMDAIRNFEGPVVGAWGNKEAGLIEAQHEYLQAFSEQSGLILGFANVVTDPDGVVREYITRLEGVDDIVSMSGTMSQIVTGRTPPETGLIDWVMPADAGATVFQQFIAHRVTHFAKIPALKPKLKEWLGGRIVYVGADLEQRDRKATSMGANPAFPRTIPGVMVQTQVLAQLLDERVVRNASDALKYVVAGLMALIGVALSLSTIRFLWRMSGFIVVFISYVGLVGGLAYSGIVFMPFAPILTVLIISFGLGVALDGFLTQRDEEFIRGAFSHYLDPAMVDQLAENPDALRLGGDKREMSIIFTDIAGFTTMSEELEPDVLTKLLNEYFDGMSDLIFQYGGAIDKFIGDAVVAHFGAPTPLANHAMKAIRCAEAMDRFCEKFRSENAHLGLGVTRIGVHSGIATVGNFGGSTRFDYTAIGDAVNVAARLESSNKTYGTRIAISEGAMDRLQAMLLAGDV
ncbi:MAG: CHASE2 domain-containing protein, partial [Pikeienuella sp.]